MITAAATNVYDAWAMAAWAASAAVSVASVTMGCLKYNRRNHAERMAKINIEATRAAAESYRATVEAEDR